MFKLCIHFLRLMCSKLQPNTTRFVHSDNQSATDHCPQRRGDTSAKQAVVQHRNRTLRVAQRLSELCAGIPALVYDEFGGNEGLRAHLT